MALSRSDNSVHREMKDQNYSKRLITVLDPTGVASEAYRTLSTSLLYALGDTSPKVIVVTSPGSAEGKSTVCANLGVVLAQTGKNILIADCDFRKPAMHEIFGLSNTRGITDALTSERSLKEEYQAPLPGLSLRVLTTGPLPPSPGELLASQRLSALFANMRKEFDYVLVDSPSTRLVSDPFVLATHGDGVLLTLDVRKTSKGDLQRTMRAMNMIGANVLGTVMNNVTESKGGYG